MATCNPVAKAVAATRLVPGASRVRCSRSVSCRCVVVVAVASLAGCGDAITLEIASERPVPTAVDAICVGVADRSASGGHFGRLYPLKDELATLPQTLRIEAGDADA